ncbi:MAG: hypothetical protein QOG31_246 [Thermoplasmata archaeon]|jgi:hypothetical protein|nr:hypothetical protein [Thermoplasmata archaeon]
MRRWTVALAVLLLAPLAAGQHEHHAVARAPLAVLLDVQGANEVQAGDPARFAAVAFGDDGVPDTDQVLRIEATQMGRLLLAIPAASARDADGVAQFDVLFPVAGPYLVRVLDAAGTKLAKLEGWALAPDAKPATPRMEVPASAVAGQPVRLRFWPEAANGTLVPHFYTLLEVRRAGELTYRAKLHGHDAADLGAAEADIAFPLPGAYTVDATIFQASPYGPQPIAFRPMHLQQAVQVSPGPALPAEQAPSVPTLPTPTPAAGPVVALNGTEMLVGTYDPAPQVGPGTLQRLTVLAEDAAGGLLGHDNFAARLTGPTGNVLFASRFLHESDGVLEFATTQSLPGRYHLAAWQGGAAAIGLPFQVLPAAPATLPQQVTVTGLDRAAAGIPLEVHVALQDAAGRAPANVEADVQVAGPSGVGIVSAKLRAQDGRLAFSFAPLETGPHTLRLVPYATDGQPLVFPNAAAWSTTAFNVAAGAAWPAPQKPPAPLAAAPVVASQGGLPLPWLAAGATLAAGALATVAVLLATRRRA